MFLRVTAGLPEHTAVVRERTPRSERGRSKGVSEATRDLLKPAYEILRELGTGGMATAYLAQRWDADDLCVVKVLHRYLYEDSEDDACWQRFIREGQVAAQLRHRNLVGALEFEPEVPPYIAYEYVAGVDVRGIIEEMGSGGLPLDVALTLSEGYLSGLSAAHRLRARGGHLGLVHRDISPDNLMLSFEGVPKVIDFGVASLAGSKLTAEAKAFVGKLAYASPEMLSVGPIDHRVDVYSFGLCLHEMLSGAAAFQTEEAREDGDPGEASSLLEHREMIEGILSGRLPRSPSIPDDVFAVLERATAKHRDDRFRTAEAMRSALAACQPGLPRLSEQEVGAWLQARFPARHREALELSEWCYRDSTHVSREVPPKWKRRRPRLRREVGTGAAIALVSMVSSFIVMRGWLPAGAMMLYTGCVLLMSLGVWSLTTYKTLSIRCAEVCAYVLVCCFVLVAMYGFS